MSQIGFRWFDIGKGGKLLGLNKQLWVPDETQVAVCGITDASLSRGQWGGREHKAPADECGCGLWCFKDPDIALPLPASYRTSCKAFGAVEWWGDYVEHEYGYRAEFMVLRGIWCRISRCSPVYNVPIYRTLEALCDTWDVTPIEGGTGDWDIAELA